MDFLHITKRGSIVHDDIAQAIDHLLLMEKSLDRWEFVEKIIKVWERSNPELARSYNSKSQNDAYHGSLKNKFGATADLGMRRLADMPISLRDMLALFYPDEINTKPFMVEFVKHFPQFGIADKENL